MKELQVRTGENGDVVGTLVDIPVPTPKDDEVLIKVVVTGTNPKDWKYISDKDPFNSGDDIAGLVHAVGKNVLEFRPGDRVAAFHVMRDPHGSFAEYAIAPSSTTFHIPASTSFEEAATLPLVTLTSAIGLYQILGLPEPWSHPKSEPIPFLVYGGSSAVGLFALKFARLSGLSPIIAIAGGSKAIIEQDNLADVIIDYRNNDNIVDEIKAALGGKELRHAYDAVVVDNSPHILSQVLSPAGKITGILPYTGELANGHKWKMTYVGSSHKQYEGFPAEDAVKDKDFAYLFARYLTKLLQEGRLKGHPIEVVPGGLKGIVSGLNRLKKNEVGGKKVVARIAETEGL